MKEVDKVMETMELLPIAGSLHEVLFEQDVMRDFAIEKILGFYKKKKIGKVKERKGSKPLSRRTRYIMGLMEKLTLWVALFWTVWKVVGFGRWLIGM